jgi:hypothetical protein
MAAELGRDAAWERQAVQQFNKVARNYVVSGGADVSAKE